MIAVYQRIINHQHKKEILKILDEEIQSSQDKCFTGRITRLVSCLCGFENDIKLEIADNEQIGNIISLIQNKYGNDIDKIKEESRKQLLELGYSIEVINDWLDNL